MKVYFSVNKCETSELFLNMLFRLQDIRERNSKSIESVWVNWPHVRRFECRIEIIRMIIWPNGSKGYNSRFYW